MIYDKDKFEVQVLARGCCLDTIETSDGTKFYKIETASVRVNPEAFNAWNTARVFLEPDDFDCDDDYDAYVAKKSWERASVIERIKELAGMPKGIVSNALAEFFSIVQMTEVTS